MSQIRVTGKDFQPPYDGLNRVHQVGVSWNKFMKFAITVGQPIFRAAFPNTAWSVPLAIYKAFAVICALEFNNRRIARTRLYKLLEQSEKANFSYWIGMAVAGISADHLLHVSRLFHAGAFKSAGFLTVDPNTNRLADLIGVDSSGDWHVIEAKARQYKPSVKDRQKWKTQTTTILDIHGSAPVTHSYSLASIGDSLSAELVDPEQNREILRRRIDFVSGSLNRGYYEPFREWLTQDARLVTLQDRELKARRVTFDALDDRSIYVGLANDMDGSNNIEDFTTQVEPFETETAYLGTDGIAVISSTDEALR